MRHHPPTAAAALQSRPTRSLVVLALLACALSLALSLALAPPAEAATLSVKDFGARGNGTTDDAGAINAALSAAPAGSTVVVPPGTYRVNSRISLKSNVTLSGPGATLYMPPAPDDTALLKGSGTSGAKVIGLRLLSEHGSGRSNVYGLMAESASSLLLKDVTTEEMEVGVKIKYSTNITMTNYTALNDGQMYLAGIKGGVFTNLNLQSIRGSNNHNLYLEQGNEDLVFDGLRVAGGDGYSIHLYHESSNISKRITFRHVRLDSPNKGIVVCRYQDVRFEDVTGAVRSGEAAVMLNTLNNFSLTGFDLAGGSAAVMVYSEPKGPVSNVSLRNGIYRQSRLLGNSSLISGLNVSDTRPYSSLSATQLREFQSTLSSYSNGPFADVSTWHPYATAIAGLDAKGIITGYPNETFRPGATLLRGQSAKVITGAVALPVTESLVPPFTDMGPDSPTSLYPHDYVAAAYQKRIMVGLSKTVFGPYQNVSRAQLVTLVVRSAKSLKPGALQQPPAGYQSQMGYFDPAHSTAMAWAEYNGLLKGLQGYGKGWNPWALMNRGEVAQVVWNFVQK